MSVKAQIDDSVGRSQQFSIQTDIDAAQNEPMVSHVMNRGIRQLLDNDMSLNEMYRAVFSKMQIVNYTSEDLYDSGDLVWYLDNASGDLYLLRCVVPQNSNDPGTARVDGKLDDNELKALGWVNENPNLNILSSSVIDVVDKLVQSAVEDHADDKTMHPYGKMSIDSGSPDYIGTKLLKSDFSNLDQRRSTTFFPQTVVKLDEGNAVIGGYCRQFGEVMEYDIILQLGSAEDNASYSPDAGLQSISANTEIFDTADENAMSLGFQNNMKYFASTQDMSIFSNPSGVQTGKSKKGVIVQMQRNDYANTYSAKIQFPYQFADTRYALMSNSMLSQANGDVSIVPSANDIAFCDKTRNSVVVLDITFPDSRRYGQPGYNTESNGLIANTFHIKAVGTARTSTGA